MNTRLTAVACAALSWPLGGCTGEVETPAAMPPSTTVVPVADGRALQSGNIGERCDGADLAVKVDALVAGMTLEQKVSEMHGDERHRELVAAIDGFFQAGGDASLGIPMFRMVDGARGVRTGEAVKSEGTATAFPVAMARGATWDPELERRVGFAIGKEVVAKGGNVLLAPTINMLRHPGWGRAQETYSEDPVHMADLATAFIGGAQNHVLATAKHFAVNSIENTRFDVSANLDERTLREMYLPHFRRAVEEAHVAAVMTAYNRVNDTYCAENTHLLSDILLGEWGFRGLVMSDWIVGTRSTVPSALAGLDLEMPVANYYGQPLIDAVHAGEVEESVVDGAVSRIIRGKLCFGLDAPKPLDPSAVESDEHTALAREVAEKGIVLLKNEGPALPLAADTRSIAMVGKLIVMANLGDKGSSAVVPSYAVTPLDGLKAAAGSAEVIDVPTDEPTAEELERIAAADVAIVVAGLTFENEGEFIPIADQLGGRARGGDRANLDLPDVQEALIAQVAARANRTIVVLEAGSAVTVRSWVDSIDALVMAWYPGMEGGNALANVLFGRVNPSGKLPVTFPQSMNDLPPWDIVSHEVDYGYFHGYRLLDHHGVEPEFAFGHGLSYTTFAVDRLVVHGDVGPSQEDVVRLRVDVQNTGSREGDEVVQVYASYPEVPVERAERELVAFRRVSLEPNQVVTVEVEVAVKDLARYDEAASAWTVDAGEYVFHAGTSSRDLPLSATFRVR